MKHLGPEQGGGEMEAWARTQLANLKVPPINLDDINEVLEAARFVTEEDYTDAPEVSLGSLLGGELQVTIDEGQLTWQAVSMYHDALIVRQEGSEIASEAYLVIGGSLFLTPTHEELLTEEEAEILPDIAWGSVGMDEEFLQQLLTVPFVVSPGGFCKDAHLYYKPAFTLHDLMRPELVDKSFDEPLEGQLIAIEVPQGGVLSLFVSDTGYITPPVRHLDRLLSNQPFKRF